MKYFHVRDNSQALIAGLLAAGVTTGIAFAVATIVPIQAPATQIDGRYFGMHLCQEYVPSWAWNCDAFKSSAEIQTDLSYSIAGLTPPPIPVDRWLASQGVGAEVAAREQIAGWSVFGAFVLAFIDRRAHV